MEEEALTALPSSGQNLLCDQFGLYRSIKSFIWMILYFITKKGGYYTSLASLNSINVCPSCSMALVKNMSLLKCFPVVTVKWLNTPPSHSLLMYIIRCLYMLQILTSHIWSREVNHAAGVVQKASLKCMTFSWRFLYHITPDPYFSFLTSTLCSGLQFGL